MTNKSQAPNPKQTKCHCERSEAIPSMKQRDCFPRALGVAMSVCLLFGILNITPVFAQVYKGVEADRLVTGSEMVRFEKEDASSVPVYVKLNTEATISFSQFSSKVRPILKMRTQDNLQLKRSEKDRLDYTHYRYQQIYKGFPVEGGIYIAHVKDDGVVSINGKFFEQLNVDCYPTSSEPQALNKALQYVNALQYKWEIGAEENDIKFILADPTATYFPKAELVLAPVGGNYAVSNNFRLAYKFDIYAHDPLSRQYVFVDAKNGDIIWTLNRIHHTDSTGTAITRYSGSQTITTDYTGSDFRLRETTRGSGIRTYDMERGFNYGNAVDFTDDDNVWNNVNANQDEVATDAHWGAAITYDYYYNNYGRNSYNNNGTAILSYVHYKPPGPPGGGYNNAFWDGSRMTYGDGDGIIFTPLTSLDVCGHEITHGVISYTANLDYSYQSGALSESFSDVFGTAIEFYAKPDSANWLIGDEITINGLGIRSMADPNAYGDPDTYLGTYWYTGSGDNGGVHTNSGVQNYWFYLLSVGGTGTNDLGNSYSLAGIGIDKAAQIAYRTLTRYLTNTSQYADARFYSIRSAIDLFGDCSQEVIQTTNGWYAVGVGSTYTPNPLSVSFTASSTTYCDVPVTIQFKNNILGADSMLWRFGDGSTSNEANPCHTYTEFADYNVKLIAYGDACSNGIDSLTLDAVVQLDSENACDLLLPSDGQGCKQTADTGFLYDAGGAAGNYADNKVSWVTIEHPQATSLTLTFSSFNYELNYDYLYIYDGPTTSSPLIGAYTGSSLPNGGSVSASGNALTLKHFSDPSITAAGFALNWAFIGIPLPIELLSFEARLSGEVINLVWTTASETNNDYFTVERSKNGLDFEDIIKVDGAGTSQRGITYLAVDDNPPLFPLNKGGQGVVYYRLKQTDYDETFTYSKIVAINLEASASALAIDQIYPTNAHTQVNRISSAIIIRESSGYSTPPTTTCIHRNYFCDAILTKKRWITCGKRYPKYNSIVSRRTISMGWVFKIRQWTTITEIPRPTNASGVRLIHEIDCKPIFKRFKTGSTLCIGIEPCYNKK